MRHIVLSIGSSRRVLLAVAVAVALAASGAAARAEPTAAEVAAFVAKYRCEVAVRLLQIHATPGRDDIQNRFLILSRADVPKDYVQCAFEDLDRKVYCEAASGAFADTPRTMFLAPAAIAALGRLGFSTDGATENFKLRRDAGDLTAVADLMLTALAIGFDATARTPLTFDAPDAPDDLGYCADDA